MLVRKTLSLSDCELKMEGDAGVFSGYASVFGGVDSYGDTIMKGAFADTLKNDGVPKMFYNHNIWDGLPIGKYQIVQEDSAACSSGRAHARHGAIVRRTRGHEASDHRRLVGWRVSARWRLPDHQGWR